jgi:glutathione S-transferase
MGDTRRLIQLSYSPWSERARWALDHHGLAYEIVEHVPFLGEWKLRRIAGKKGPATVPLLVDGDTRLTDSWDIAQYAERRGHGEKLFPQELEPRIREWTDLADRTCSVGRALVVSGLLASNDALDEGLPFPAPHFLLPMMRPVTRYAIQWFGRKYDILRSTPAEIEDRMRPALDRLRAAVKTSPHILGRFSYADIAMATVLQGISPVGNGFIRLGPATRRAWTRPPLERDYPDLVRWRDNLYLDHRPRATKRGDAPEKRAESARQGAPERPS